MKKTSTSKSAFFNLRFLIASVLCLFGVFLALLGSGAFSSAFAQPNGSKNGRSTTRQDAPGTQTPDVMRLIGPAVVNNLRDLPHIQPGPKFEREVMMRHPRKGSGEPSESRTSPFPRFQSLLGKIFRPIPNIPTPLLTFDGVSRVGPPVACNCLPPDTNGDVGPNHYVQSVNEAFRVFDKSGNPAGPVTSFDDFFGQPALMGTPCGDGANQGDPFVLYDHVADRWLISDFAFASLAGPFYQCVGVSQTGDPTGAYNLYALQVDSMNPTFIGDYPKFGLWSDPQPGGAYHFTVNLFSFNPVVFHGVRVFALDRASMLGGGPANAIAFTILAGLGDSYSLLPANFRTGAPPPAGRDEFLLSIDSPFSGGVVLTQVHGWLFHVDFATPGNSTIGVGTDHDPNADITVNGFIDTFDDNFNTDLVPQPGTEQRLDTVGDRLFTPVVYQNLNGTESLWANSTDFLNYPNGPIAVRWYQFNVTGGSFPATPVQQQSWDNGGDGLWRWMAAVAVDQNGNMAVGYSTSSDTIFPSIRYAGRLAGDPLNNLGQGEAILYAGSGSQTHPEPNARWGDYSMNVVDPSDGLTFWATNEYYPMTTDADWFTRVGKFKFPTVRATPTPRPRPTPAPRP